MGTKITPSMVAMAKFFQIHTENVSNDKLRLGQRFHNMYLTEPYLKDGKDLFYMDTPNALTTILDWLEENQYNDTLPEIIIREEYASYKERR